ncbi:MAG: NUDIX domain-containing protein [Geodermatophilaceae bacterium]|nr:NUDIX domain-containing protein [Geodermatophilaceae bacterium]
MTARSEPIQGHPATPDSYLSSSNWHSPAVRTASRVLVLDRDQQVLLFGARIVELDTPPAEVVFWYTPGGGVDPGESLRAAAVRELAEEIGLVVGAADLEGPVWFRRSVDHFLGKDMDSRETFFVLRDVEHVIDVSGQTEIERYEDQPFRWWTLEEIASSRERFAPRDLATVLPAVLAGRWSGSPEFVDVQDRDCSG